MDKHKRSAHIILASQANLQFKEMLPIKSRSTAFSMRSKKRESLRKWIFNMDARISNTRIACTSIITSFVPNVNEWRILKDAITKN